MVMLTTLLLSSPVSHQYSPLSVEYAGLMAQGNSVAPTQVLTHSLTFPFTFRITVHPAVALKPLHEKAMELYSKICSRVGTITGKAALRQRYRYKERLYEEIQHY